jgi:ABC-2 type transport system permease protein
VSHTAALPLPARAGATGAGRPSWLVVAEQEGRQLWLSGRAPALVCGYSVVLSCVAYLAATNQVLNFLEQREAVNLTLQVALAVGALMSLVTSADAISGDRERGTLEALLLTPASRGAIVVGKMAAAMSLWLGCWLVSVPYLWVLGRGVSVVAQSLLLGLAVGTLLALGLASVGQLISALSRSNRTSLSLSVFTLIALTAPTQLPTGLAATWIGGALIRLNPVGAALHYLTSVLVQGRVWTDQLSYLASPLLTALLAGAALLLASPRILTLEPGVRR